MKIGFSILSHQAPGPLLEQLLFQLNRFPQKYIAIHHDFHQADFDNSLFKGLSYELVKNYTQTYWSHTNNIRAILETFRILYSQNCDWYITLSANCYPIKSPAYILNFLENTDVDGFIECNNVLTDHFDFYKYFRKGFQTKYLFKIPFINKQGKLCQKAIRRPRRKDHILLNNTFIPYHGSDWFIINRLSIEYLLSNEDKISTLVNFLVDVNKGPDINVCPPEVVFQTILANNSKLKLSNSYYRFLDWKNSKNWHPNVLTMNHWENIKKSDALFARKLDSTLSKELIEAINTYLLNT